MHDQASYFSLLGGESIEIARMLQCPSSWLVREYARLGELFQLAWRGVHRNCENAAMPKFMAGSRICTIRRTISACLENAAMPKFMAGSRTLEIPTSTSHERHHCSAELCSCSVAVRVCEALN
jgi:hypothetical protein